jgi:hypothetical protein
MRRTPFGSVATIAETAFSVLKRKCGLSWVRSTAKRASASWACRRAASDSRTRYRRKYSHAKPAATIPPKVPGRSGNAD